MGMAVLRPVPCVWPHLIYRPYPCLSDIYTSLLPNSSLVMSNAQQSIVKAEAPGEKKLSADEQKALDLQNQGRLHRRPHIHAHR